MNVFVFDIETIPDCESARQINGWQDLSSEEVGAALMAKTRAKTGSEFVPLYLQKIVAISVVYRYADKVKVWSLGNLESNEADLIQRFFQGISKYQPTIVSWNGSGFDLPVLHYRSLLQGVSAPEYWDVGDLDQRNRYNNYLNRYHHKHVDLMDVLAAYQARANAPLDDIAQLLGCPGKMGMHGDKVWQAYQDGQLEQIRNYCETDVINTYLVYLRFELIRGHLDTEGYERELQLVRETLQSAPEAHLQAFLAAWK
jgi:predicted PolB exonuclease-like 3'-5' exonuclease